MNPQPDQSKKKTKKIPSSWVNHLLYLIEFNERENTYTAPKDQYWIRSERIKAWLKEVR